MSRKNYPILVLISLAMFLLIASPAMADLEDVKQATVSIESMCGEGDQAMISSGSGFLVSSDGFIVTNAHVILSNDIVVDVKVGERTHRVSGTLLYIDDLMDIAIVKVELGGLDYLIMGDDTELSLGERLFAVGSPLVFTDIFTDGIYSAYNEELGMLQHTAELSHGNSGGPLVTEDGVVMGVNTIVVAFPGESRYYFAIPITLVAAVLEGLQSQGSLNEIIVDCYERLGDDDPGGTTDPPPIDPYIPDDPGVGTWDLEVNAALVDDLIYYYPEDWTGWSSDAFGYYLDLPWFFDVTTSTDDEFISTGLDFYASYENDTDAYWAAVPIVAMYIGYPDVESFHEFKQFIDDQFYMEGFMKDDSYETENIDSSNSDLEFDGYWYDGTYDSGFESLSRLTYFIRHKSRRDAYYCIDFTFVNTLDEYTFSDITLQIVFQSLFSFDVI